MANWLFFVLCPLSFVLCPLFCLIFGLLLVIGYLLLVRDERTKNPAFAGAGCGEINNQQSTTTGNREQGTGNREAEELQELQERVNSE